MIVLLITLPVKSFDQKCVAHRHACARGHSGEAQKPISFFLPRDHSEWLIDVLLPQGKVFSGKGGK